jgi:hypothetical protein
MEKINFRSKKQWQEDRFTEVCEAIAKQYESLKPIPVEWVEEYNELITITGKDTE